MRMVGAAAVLAAVVVGAGAVSGAGALPGVAGGPGGTETRSDFRALDAIGQDSLGRAVFTGKGMCHACHGPVGKGTPLAPDLTDGEWLNGDGSLEQIVEVVKVGVPRPKQHPAPMPPMGGAQLSDEEVQAVARYVLSLKPAG
jgi:mono/diheme cytochrome c family protein